MNEYLQALAGAIQDLYGLRATHLQSVPVTEKFQGKTIWDGEVEVFAVTGHPRAKKCYAWSHPDGEGDKYARYFAILELPPVDSPRRAVQAAIVSEAEG